MSLASKKELITHLQQFITDERLQKINSVLESRTRFLTVVLEDLYQPHNASAVLRSCDCFGIQDVHIIENENEFSPSKGVTIGSDQWLSLKKYNEKSGPNTRQCFQSLRQDGYKIIATTPHEQDVSINELPLDEKTAIVFGSELTGLSDEAMAEADGYVKIPMVGFSESFNISVSAALCLYELSTRLRKDNGKWPLNDREKVNLRLDWIRNSVREVEMIEKRFWAENKKIIYDFEGLLYASNTESLGL